MNFQEILLNFTNFHKFSRKIIKSDATHKFCSAGSNGSVWNLDPGSRIRIRKSANQKHMEI
jgi:hypothetical protein